MLSKYLLTRPKRLDILSNMKLASTIALGTFILPALVTGAAIDNRDADSEKEAPAYVWASKSKWDADSGKEAPAYIWASKIKRNAVLEKEGPVNI